jgi:hypothetical protein
MNSLTRSRVYFMLAAIILGGAAFGMQRASSNGSLKIIKKALPIRKPLPDLDRAVLSPVEIVGASRLKPELEEELGTKEYIDWSMAWPGRRGERMRLALSVTYYTGLLDQVPHVPEECMHQAGLQQAEDATLDVDMPGLGGLQKLRRLIFFPREEIGDMTYIYYTIRVNDEFYSDRNRVRLRMADFRDTHLYYSKVELAIQAPADADRKQLDSRATFVMDKLLTELVRNHWPLKGWERGGPPAGKDSSAAVKDVTEAH